MPNPQTPKKPAASAKRAAPARPAAPAKAPITSLTLPSRFRPRLLVDGPVGLPGPGDLPPSGGAALPDLDPDLAASCWKAPVTSGSKGMQLYASLGGDLTSDQVRDLAMQLAQEMTKKHPGLVLWKMTKSLRPGKVFLDWSQNVAAKTTISPYSLRGRELPCVAAPRTWDEVEQGAEEPDSLRQLMYDEVLDRIQRDGDLIADLP